jgi:hypothetical protein
MSAEMKALYDSAHQAGMKAVVNLQVVPMIVGEETNLFSGKIDYNKPTYFVEDGVCGFAWVNVKPGNSKFANWLKKNELARSDSYYGGVTVWVSAFNQSMQKKEAYARGFAEVLRNAGINAYSQSRMD